jgi:hypothetical protein
MLNEPPQGTRRKSAVRELSGERNRACPLQRRSTCAAKEVPLTSLFTPRAERRISEIDQTR